VTTTEFEEIKFYGGVDKPYGFTYGEWTTKWWDWIMPIQRKKSPLHDETGALWTANQPPSDVWFLIGNFATESSKFKTFPHRRIKMESGRSILFPVLNCLATFLEYTHLKTDEDLLRHVRKDVNSVVIKKLFINEKMYEPVRVTSDPKIFMLSIIEDNAFGIRNSGLTDAAADGYWAFIKPLSKGNYTIRFEGSCENGRLSAGASYEVDIV
jgi:hypothetical protein